MGGSVTALKYQKRKRDRVSVYLDGRFAFGVPEIVAARLKVGQSLSDAEIEALREHGCVEEAYNRALDYLSYRPRSQAEIVTFLQRHDVPDAQAEEVVERLKAAGLVDDEAFAQFWVENRERFRPRGLRALRYELQRKGIGQEAIDQALEGVDPLAGAYQAAAKKAQQLSHLDRPEFLRKLVDHLARRGFDYDVAKEVANRYWSELGLHTEPLT
ncbi:MAG: RecX family transcriptional regulator [Anaerolineae bacterium]|nr:RecX family transcriptional regulator [Anaerolineae bacterium]